MSFINENNFDKAKNNNLDKRICKNAIDKIIKRIKSLTVSHGITLLTLKELL